MDRRVKYVRYNAGSVDERYKLSML